LIHIVRNKAERNLGFTLLELLISIAILAVVMAGFSQSIGTAISSYSDTKNSQDRLAQARFAMERMNLFVQETDYILKPDDVNQEIVRLSERAMDTYDNASHAYDADGDGITDADNDADGMINEDGLDTGVPDPFDYITFDLDKSESGNWKLRETTPDYSTATPGDYKTPRILCEHVTAFRCSRLGVESPLVEIELTLNDGVNTVTLTTRARARLLSSQ
jgi:prepilin-type N-terminal cleavage/methylation domain-containing protein